MEQIPILVKFQHRHHLFCLGEVKGYLIVGRYPDGSVGEFFWRAGSQGDFNRGIINALFESISLGLQRGIPLREFALHFVRTNFKPSGFTGDRDVPNASSILDYAFRKLMLRFPGEVGPEGTDYWR